MTLLRTLVLASTLLACGGDDDSGSGIALANLGTSIGTAYCAKAFECCTAAEISERFAGAPFTDEPGCVQFNTRFFDALLPMYQASIDAGKMTYSASAASQCVAALRAQTCNDFASEHDELASACPNPFTGQVENNMACNFDNECASEYCEGDTQFGNNPQPGVCKPMPAVGQSCPDFDCATGAYCDAGTCAALKADGASCFSGEQCASGACNESGSGGTCGAPMTCNGL